MLRIENERYPWINRELLTKVLKSSEKSCDTQLIDFELHNAIGVGENFTSQLIRVTVNYACAISKKDGSDTVHTKSFVIKTSLAKKIHEVFAHIEIFDKEIVFYRDMLPQIKYHAKSIQADLKFSPSCYLIREKPLCLVFEDHKVDGYHNLNKRMGLNFQQTEIILLKLAKFHAAGAMVYEEHPEYFDHHRKNIFRPDTVAITGSFTHGMRLVNTMCRQWPCMERYADKLETVQKIMLNKVSTQFVYDPKVFNTLTHGDLWMNNLMYKMDELENVIDVLMVDYQMGVYGSPANDLSFLFYTSTANGVVERDWDRLIQIYHEELVKSLESVKYTKSFPTLSEMQIEFLQRSLYAVMLSFIMICTGRFGDNAHVTGVDSFTENPGHTLTNNEMFEIPELKQRLVYLLDYYDRKGFLND